MSFNPVNAQLLFKKNDPQDPRLGEMLDNKNPQCIIQGYADEEGVVLSKGRLGAKEGPDAIRSVFYKMTPSLEKKILKFNDLGNIKMEGDLLSRHERAEESALQVLKSKKKLITLGGGHDYGFPDFSAFVNHVQSVKKKPFIINFDAHLDVRPDTNGPSSGTPFYKLLSKYDKLDFFEVGIQDWCNSQAHLQWAQKKKAKVITYNEISKTKDFTSLLYKKIFKFFDKKKHVLGLSVDIDAFSSAFSPGASQVFPLGLDPKDFFTCFQKIVNDFNPLLLGIYEVNPSFDQDQRTAKLAAILMHTFLHQKPL